MSTTSALSVTLRTETGKGAARRARRAGQVPAVIYGHGGEPRHVLLPTRRLAAILRANGLNAIVDLDIEGDKQLVLTKVVDIHPIRDAILHVDFIAVNRGEKVSVEVPVVLEGDPQSSTLVTQETTSVEIEAEALHIPEQIVVSIEGAEAGTSITAGDLVIPEGVTLLTDPGTLIAAIAGTSAAPAEGDE